MSITVLAATSVGGGTPTVTSAAQTFAKSGIVRARAAVTALAAPSSPLTVAIQTSPDSVTYTTVETQVVDFTAPNDFEQDFPLGKYSTGSLTNYKVVFACAGSPPVTVSATQD